MTQAQSDWLQAAAWIVSYSAIWFVAGYLLGPAVFQ